MSLTNIPYGDSRAVRLQSVGLFAATMQRQTILNRLSGQLPKQADAEKSLRWQSDNSMPIVRCMDLTKTAGDQITIDLVNPIGGKPIMGERNAEGHGDKMTFSTMSVYIDQTRKPISAGGKMSQQRTAHDLRKLARAQADGYMKRLEDQLSIVHIAGARGFSNDAMWAVPLASDADFSDVCVNTVKAPTKNRHFVSVGGTSLVSASDATNGYGGSDKVTSADLMKFALVDNLRSIIDDMAFPPPPVMLPGDEAAMDDPLYMLLVSPAQYESLKTDSATTFRTFQAQALARASNANQHPLFRGEVGIWNGILIKKMSRPIRFRLNGTDTIQYCASATTETETAYTCGTYAGYAIDRAVLLGGQALCEAYGKTRQTGNPYFWSEKELDHGDKLEVLIGGICGKAKVRFQIDQGDGVGLSYTDFGVIAVDTAVAINS